MTTDLNDKAKDKTAIVGHIYNVLRERAINHEFLPGDRINELELSTELGVSRSPIREALSRLVSEQMLSFVPNKGFFRLPLDFVEVKNLFEVRRALETEAAKLVCVRASDEAIAEFADRWVETSRNLADLPSIEIAKVDEVFHESLLGLSGNLEFQKSVQSLNARIRFVRSIAIENPRFRQGVNSNGTQAVSATLDEHTLIIEALRKRDVDRLVDLLDRHIQLSLEDAVALIKEGLARIYIKSHIA